MRDDRLYLHHIVECISRIEDYTEEGKDAFLADRKTQDAVMRNLQVLAESSKRLSAEAREAHPEIDWRGMSGLRNILVHEYLGVNLERVWEAVSGDLPGLKRRAETLLNELGGRG